MTRDHSVRLSFISVSDVTNFRSERGPEKLFTKLRPVFLNISMKYICIYQIVYIYIYKYRYISDTFCQININLKILTNKEIESL